MLKRCLYCVTVLMLSALSTGCFGPSAQTEAENAARAGQYDKAIELFGELAKTSNDPGVFIHRGNCHSQLGNLDAALADYDHALRLIDDRAINGEDRELPYLYHSRGAAYQRAKKYVLAVVEFEKTIEAKPDYPDVSNNLAWLLATCPDPAARNSKRALELAEQELRRDPKHPSILDTVAACYASAGDFAQAVTYQEQALALCDESYKSDFQARLKLYQDETSFVDGGT